MHCMHTIYQHITTRTCHYSITVGFFHMDKPPMRSAPAWRPCHGNGPRLLDADLASSVRTLGPAMAMQQEPVDWRYLITIYEAYVIEGIYLHIPIDSTYLPLEYSLWPLYFIWFTWGPFLIFKICSSTNIESPMFHNPMKAHFNPISCRWLSSQVYIICR